jgi:hypothetical protein
MSESSYDWLPITLFIAQPETIWGVLFNVFVCVAILVGSMFLAHGLVPLISVNDRPPGHTDWILCTTMIVLFVLQYLFGLTFAIIIMGMLTLEIFLCSLIWG